MRPWHHIPVDSKKGQPNEFSNVYFCDTCEYGTVRPLPSRAEVATFYELERYYTHGESQFESGEPSTLLDRVRIHLAWRFDFGRPVDADRIHAVVGPGARRICDIGCGDGALARSLAELGHRVVAIEPDPRALGGRHGELEFHVGSAEELPPEVRSRRFDCVIMSHVLEHCVDPIRALSNARSLLAPGAALVCEVPNNASAALRFHGSAWEMLDVPRHLHFFTARSLKRFCEHAGLVVESTGFGHYTRQFHNDWIATERHNWEALAESLGPGKLPARTSRVRAFGLLFRTLLGPAHAKYDSVNVVARLPS
jgi:2-polyprenyl-3-methyl-5-hydroxy-6-metoxy-1,4-benzoquinol methylase